MPSDTKTKDCSEEQITKPTNECPCGHMIKFHKSSVRWNKKKEQMDCRIKCRFCKCNILLEQCHCFFLPYRELFL